MMSGTARDFRDNGMEMGITPILPPDVNSPTQVVGMSGAFSRAVNNDVKPAAAPILPANDGQQLANDAIGVGQNLSGQQQTVGMQVKQSDATYLGSQVGQAVSQVATGLSSILGAEAKDAQAIRQKAELEDEQKPAAAAPPPQFNMPSMTSGMSGGPGGR